MAANSVSFSPFASARTKFVLLGAPGALGDQIASSVRSLKHFEYVNIAPDRKIGAGARTSSRRSSEDPVLHEMRHWFFGRKRTRGFLLRGFPHSLRQALILDEWLEARDETLSGCLLIDCDYQMAMEQASARLVCPTDQTVSYSSSDQAVACTVCGSPMVSDGERAQNEVRSWFAHHAQSAGAAACYYDDRGQLFRFDAATSSLEDVARTAAAVAVDR